MNRWANLDSSSKTPGKHKRQKRDFYLNPFKKQKNKHGTGLLRDKENKWKKEKVKIKCS